MKRVIIIEEKDFDNLLTKFANALLRYKYKPYGYTLISNETGKKVDELNHMLGVLLVPWKEVFKI